MPADDQPCLFPPQTHVVSNNTRSWKKSNVGRLKKNSVPHRDEREKFFLFGVQLSRRHSLSEGTAWRLSSSGVMIPASLLAGPSGRMYLIAPADKSREGGRALPVVREGEEGGGVETLRSDKAGGGRGGESVGRSGEPRFTLEPGGERGAATWRKRRNCWGGRGPLRINHGLGPLRRTHSLGSSGDITQAACPTVLQF